MGRKDSCLCHAAGFIHPVYVCAIQNIYRMATLFKSAPEGGCARHRVKVCSYHLTISDESLDQKPCTLLLSIIHFDNHQSNSVVTYYGPKMGIKGDLFTAL